MNDGFIIDNWPKLVKNRPVTWRSDFKKQLDASIMNLYSSEHCRALEASSYTYIWVTVFKNGPSKICGRQYLKNLKWYGLSKRLSIYYDISLFQYIEIYLCSVFFTFVHSICEWIYAFVLYVYSPSILATFINFTRFFWFFDITLLQRN